MNNVEQKIQEFIEDVTKLVLSHFGKKIIKSHKNDDTKEYKLLYHYIFEAASWKPEVDWESIYKKEAVAKIVDDIETEFEFSNQKPLQFVEITHSDIVLNPDTFEPEIAFYLLVNNPVYKPNPNKHIIGII